MSFFDVITLTPSLYPPIFIVRVGTIRNHTSFANRWKVKSFSDWFLCVYFFEREVEATDVLCASSIWYVDPYLHLIWGPELWNLKCKASTRTNSLNGKLNVKQWYLKCAFVLARPPAIRFAHFNCALISTSRNKNLANLTKFTNTRMVHNRNNEIIHAIMHNDRH